MLSPRARSLLLVSLLTLFALPLGACETKSKNVANDVASDTNKADTNGEDTDQPAPDTSGADTVTGEDTTSADTHTPPDTQSGEMVPVTIHANIITPTNYAGHLYSLFRASFGAGSKMADLRGTNMVSGDYSAQFMLKHLYKDLGLAMDTASANSVPLPIISLVRQIYGQAMVDGRGDDDMSAIAGITEKLAGVSLKK